MSQTDKDYSKKIVEKAHLLPHSQGPRPQKWAQIAAETTFLFLQTLVVYLYISLKNSAFLAKIVPLLKAVV